MKVGIIGGGYVGSATATMINTDEHECIVYDLDSSKCQPSDAKFEDLAGSRFFFICVPTPESADGSCNTNIVKSCVQKLREAYPEASIVVRSTVPPGTCLGFDVNFMPEFLTEKNWRQDILNCSAWIVGLREGEDQESFKRDFQSGIFKKECIDNGQVHWTNTSAAEAVKYIRNSYLATKVAFFNEIEEYCQVKQIPFEFVRSLTVLDPRIGPSHSFAPGHDGLRGFGGTCLPKDSAGLSFEIQSVGLPATLMNAVVLRNKHDRVRTDEPDLSKLNKPSSLESPLKKTKTNGNGAHAEETTTPNGSAKKTRSTRSSSNGVKN